MENNLLMAPEAYTEVLQGLVAKYMRFAMQHNIDLKDKGLEFVKYYNLIAHKAHKCMFCQTEDELIHYKNFILEAQQKLEEYEKSYE